MTSGFGAEAVVVSAGAGKRWLPGDGGVDFLISVLAGPGAGLGLLCDMPERAWAAALGFKLGSWALAL